MRHRHTLWLALLVGASACQDTPVTPSAPAAPRYTLASGGTDLRSGYDYLCALRGGVVACFGERDEGQPIGVHRAAAGTFVQLATGATHACGLRSDGAVQCWGVDDFGRAPPVRRAATGSYTAVSAGQSHGCAVRTDGRVECWGSNAYGQAPALVTPRTGAFTQVNASAASTCALRTDGVVECWGIPDRAPPVRTAPSGTYVKIAEALGNTNCALTSTGVADCWGYQNFWQAGPWVQVVSGAGHQCALRSNGVPLCWGYPASWEGLDERTVERGGGWSRITAGSYHTCGLRADGYFECFGVQAMGSNAPDVVPVADTPGSALNAAWRILVAWRDLNSNEHRTEIERSVTDRDRNPTSWTPIGTVGANRTAFKDSVAPGATYVYQVRVCNDAGCSAWKRSNPTSFPATVPSAPSAPAATGHTCGLASCAHVAWTSDDTFVETFRLQRRVNAGGGYGAWREMAAQSRSSTSFDDYGLTPGARYQYRVRACNRRGCSAYGVSNAVVAPSPPPPSAPASLTASVMGSYMYVVWGDVADEATYELQRRQHDGAAYGAWSAPIIRTTDDTAHTDPVVRGTRYQYRVRACNQGGCSAYTSSTPTQA
jgi:Regulator of chromosome condensation (RCC1) repeat